MADITLLGASYPDVPAVDLPKTGGETVRFYENGGGTPAISVVDTTDAAGGTVRTITALNISDSTLETADQLASGVTGYNKNGVKLTGTGGGGTPSATSHTIYFEFSDSTDTTITGYWDDSFISDAITATTPTTYGSKTVSLAQLDGVTWYEPANIPIGVELIDYTKVTNGVYIGEDGEEHANEWSLASDYTLVDPGMTFSYTGWYWYYVGVYDLNKNFLRAIYVYTDGTVDPNDSNTAHGVLSGNELMGASYIRLCGADSNSSKMSLIRTA